MQAVILAGGLGTRLRPITYHIPKALAPICGKPFLGYILKMLKSQGIIDIVICANYNMSEKFLTTLGNGKNWGLSIKYSFEKETLDTAGALKRAEALFKNVFILIYGDTYLDIIYKKIYNVFSRRQKPILVILYNGTEIKNRVDNVLVGKNNLIKQYVKTPLVYNKKSYSWTGVAVIKKDILTMIDKNKQISLEKEIFPKLIEEEKISSYITNQRYYDIGTRYGLKEFTVLKSRL